MTPEDGPPPPPPAGSEPSVPPLPPLPKPADAIRPIGLAPADRNKRVLLALVVPNIVALALLGMTALLLNSTSDHALSDNRSGTYILAEFVLIPVLMGLTAAFCLRDTETGLGINVLVSFANTAIAIALSALILHEGVICLIMVSPLLACFIALGGLTGRLLFRSRARKLQLSIVPVLVLLIAADACSPHDFENAVTDVVTIKASPEQVWKYVIDYPAIQEKPDYWLWKIGLPAPVQSTATGHYVGARRRCAFQHDIAYDERIVELEPARKLTFDIIAQPNDPEILDHLVLKRGQMVLRDNHDGTTTLIGTTWYKLKVYPTAYYDLWTQSIMRNVHFRVMHHIQHLAEAEKRSLATRL